MQDQIPELSYILPYLAEALANNLNLRAEIDRKYAQDELRYYQAAAASPCFHCRNFDLGDIEKSVYCRKVLGLLEAGVDISYIFRKGWPQAYKYVKRGSGVLFFDDFVIYMRSRMNAITLEMTNAEFSGLLYAALYLAIVFKRPVHLGLTGEELYKMIEIQHAQNRGDDPDEPKWENIPEAIREQAERLLSRIESELGWSLERCQVFERLELEIDNAYELIMLSENLSFSELGLGIQHSRQDFLECLCYLVDFEQLQGAEEAEIAESDEALQRLLDRLVAAIRVKLLARAYTELKRLYFRNAKENLYALIEELRREGDDARQALAQRDNEIRQLRSTYRTGLERQLAEKEREVRQLQEELQRERDKDKELFALREFAFAQKQEELPTAKEEIVLPAIRCLIIGGYPTWQQKMKAAVPESFTFISAETVTFDINLLRRADLVVINTAVLSHKIYYRVVENIPKTTKLGYLTAVSIDLALDELRRLIDEL